MSSFYGKTKNFSFSWDDGGHTSDGSDLLELIGEEGGLRDWLSSSSSFPEEDGNNISININNDNDTIPLVGDDGEDYLVELDYSTILQVLFYSLLIVVTIVGNVLVCLSVILVRKLRKPGNYLLVSLAVSDLFVALFVMPFAIVFEMHGGTWPLNSGLCDLWVSADVLCCTASILNLCAISLDRYRAIMDPLEASAKTTPRRMTGIIFVVWLLSACVSLPPVLLLGNVYEDMHGRSFCSVSQNFWYQIYATMASFYVPLIVMLVVYYKILRLVAEKKKQMCWKKYQHTSIHRNSSGPGIMNSVNNPSPQSTQPLLMKKDSVASCTGGGGGRNSGTPLISIADKNNTPMMNGHLNPKMKNAVVLTNSKGGGVTTATALNNNGTNNNPHNPPAVSSVPHKKFLPFISLHRLKKEKLFGGLKEHKASTVLGIIMSAFIICWLPFFILAIMRPFLTIHNIEIPPWISSLFNWLGYVNSALNPVIYATLNRDFRLPFKEILCFRCSTLDTLMRREFYQEQYGDDKDNVQRRMSRPKINEVLDESPVAV